MKTTNTKVFAYTLMAFILVQLLCNIVFCDTFSDEAEFSYKGLMAVRGMAQMYQTDGPWYSYMPWAYLIPGYLQSWFGPSLWVPRIFSSICLLFTVAFMFLAVRNKSNASGGVISVSLLVMCLAAMRFYSLGTTESITALFVVLSFYFLTTSIRSPYKESLAILFSICAFMVRQNLFYGLGMIFVYCLISQRKIIHAICILAFTLTILISFLFPYWPEITDEIFVNMPVVKNLVVCLQNKGIDFSAGEDVSVNSSAVSANVTNLRMDFNDQWIPPESKYPVIKSDSKVIQTVGNLMKTLMEDNYVWKALYQNLSYYLPILLGFCVSIVLFTKSIKGRWLSIVKDKDNGLLLLMILYFIINIAGHWYYSKWFYYGNMIRYMCYFLPVGAIFAGICIGRLIIENEFNKKIVAIGLYILFAAQISSGAFHYKIGIPMQPAIKNVASRLRIQTKPEDKIFSLCDMHIFLLAERCPYPHMMNNQWGFVISNESAEKMRMTHFWNYNLAEQLIKEADVVVLSTGSFGYLYDLYKGRPGSGAETHDMIQRNLDQLYDLVEEVSWFYEGNLKIYRKKKK